jgi:RNA polymerase sigma-70 factor (ECF subfamily)
MNETLNSANCDHWATTQWTSVIQAVQSPDETTAMAALKVFCEQYRDVIFNFLKRRVGPDLAESYTQEFFAKNIHGKWEQRQGVLFKVKREVGGRFRYYLMSALGWFLLDMRKGKRDPLNHTVSEFPDLATLSNEDEIASECDREVAHGLVRRVMKRLRISEVYLQYFCHQISANEAADKLAISPGAFRVAVHRLVPLIKTAFREEVRLIVASEADIADEIRHLVKIIAKNS